MSWKRSITIWLADLLRLIARAGLLANAILLSAASVWLVFKLVYFTLRYLDRTLFADPW